MDAATASAKTQDLPPAGGYKKIQYARVPARTYFSGFQIIGTYVAVTTAGLYLYYLNCKKNKRDEIEMRSARNVLFPILIAERDREYLKQLRRNREEEAKLMANVKGWEVGTWYGEPIYKTIPKDKLLTPMYKEFYAHADYSSFAKRAHIKLWS